MNAKEKITLIVVAGAALVGLYFVNQTAPDIGQGISDGVSSGSTELVDDGAFVTLVLGLAIIAASPLGL